MRIQYVCEGCGQIYNDRDKAEKCEALTDEVKVSVGDVVFASAGFGWFDGDKKWISNPSALKRRARNKHGNCFGECCTYRFYYVVTVIDTHEHRTRYHLFTKAMEGKQGYRSGYTYNEHHVPIELIRDPPQRIVRDSKDLISKKATSLL